MSKPYGVVVVDDFTLTRTVFENAVSEAEDYTLLAAFSGTREAVDFILSHDVELVIMDVVMAEGENGLAAAREIKEHKPQVKLLIVTSMPEVTYISTARKIGVESFWYKEVNDEPILAVMDATMRGESVYPDAPPAVELGDIKSVDLSEREVEVLREVIRGRSNTEIAEQLEISERTVKQHVSNMLTKTGFRSRLELAVKARAGGIVIPEEE